MRTKNIETLCPLIQHDGSVVYASLSQSKKDGLGLISVKDVTSATDAIGMTTHNLVIDGRAWIIDQFKKKGYESQINNAIGANRMWHADIPKKKFGGSNYDPEWARLWQATVDAFRNIGRNDIANWMSSNVPVWTAKVHFYNPLVSQLLNQGIPASSSSSSSGGNSNSPAPVDTGGGGFVTASGPSTGLIMGGIALGAVALMMFAGGGKPKS